MNGEELYEIYRQFHIDNNCDLDVFADLEELNKLAWEDLAQSIRYRYENV